MITQQRTRSERLKCLKHENSELLWFSSLRSVAPRFSVFSPHDGIETYCATSLLELTSYHIAEANLVHNKEELHGKKRGTGVTGVHGTIGIAGIGGTGTTGQTGQIGIAGTTRKWPDPMDTWIHVNIKKDNRDYVEK